MHDQPAGLLYRPHSRNLLHQLKERYADPFVIWVWPTLISALWFLLRILPWLGRLFPGLYVPHNLTANADSLQCIAMLLLIVPCFQVRPKIEAADVEDRRIAFAASKEFRTYWGLLMLAWGTFYLFVRLRPFSGTRFCDPSIDAFNNAQGVFLFLCYWILTTITIPGRDERKPSPLPWGRLALGLAIFFTLDVVWPSGDRTRMVFRLLSGLWVGVSLGMLVGCLESEFLNAEKNRYLPTRRIIIWLLYLYSVLQVAYVGFGPEAKPELVFVHSFASVLSLPLKLLFIAFCYWLLREGRLDFYMLKTRDAIRSADSEWERFKGDRLPGTS